MECFHVTKNENKNNFQIKIKYLYFIAINGIIEYDFKLDILFFSEQYSLN